MTKSQTAAELKQWHLTIFGCDRGSIFYALYSEVVWLYTKQALLIKLYTHSEKRTKLMKKAAFRFFDHLRIILAEDFLLHLAKLTEDPGSGSRQNLTLWRLPDLVDDDQLRQLVLKDLEFIKEKGDLILKLRNKLFAHFDLEYVLFDYTFNDNTDMNVMNIEVIMERIAIIFNRLYEVKANHRMSFEAIPLEDDVDDLMTYLEKGLNADEDELYE